MSSYLISAQEREARDRIDKLTKDLRWQALLHAVRKLDGTKFGPPELDKPELKRKLPKLLEMCNA